MSRQYRAIGSALAVFFVISCTKSTVDGELSPPPAAQKAVSEIAVTGTRIPVAGNLTKRRADAADYIAASPAPPASVMSPYMPLPQVAPPYHDVGRDKFTTVAENAFKIVREAPVSTFSIDVDTASYSFVRASLNQNVLPQ
ncbi:MAG TPA: von Willebrand factor type A domain-containing protein, partial [Sphingomicrobium sp.]|nr:von Willebrand factor type A domain-containing protein [Sphingomicrobium sp.]